MDKSVFEELSVDDIEEVFVFCIQDNGGCSTDIVARYMMLEWMKKDPRTTYFRSDLSDCGLFMIDEESTTSREVMYMYLTLEATLKVEEILENVDPLKKFWKTSIRR